MLYTVSVGSVDKESTCNAEDSLQHRRLGPIPGWGKAPGEGNGNLPQYSYLGNPIDKGAWQATVHGITKVSDTT